MAYRPSTTKGFKRTATVLGQQIRKVGESRGFAVSRLLTHWAEVVGDETASIARPVNVSYGRGGLGATLILLTTGAHAPMIEMQKEQLRQKVNAVYGYNAIARIRITQTAATGFAEGQAQFGAAPRKTSGPEPTPEITHKAQSLADPVQNSDLRQALERLGRNVLTRTNK